MRGLRVLLGGVPEKPSPGPLEAVDILLGQLPDPCPDEPGIEELPEALVGRPARPSKMKPAELAGRGKAERTQAREYPQITLGLSDVSVRTPNHSGSTPTRWRAHGAGSSIAGRLLTGSRGAPRRT